ncbi:MAG: hypothetical protein ACP5NQ_05600, partial [Vulcanisaeta sp.]
RAHLTKLIYEVFTDKRPAVNVVIVGMQGSGKSSYAYYALKTAYLMKKARSYILRSGSVLSGIEAYVRDHGIELCMHRQCDSPDAIDNELKDFVYVGYDDYERLRDLILRITGGDSMEVPALFLDDLLLKDSYFLGGLHRNVYVAFKKLYALHRSVADIMIMTAPSIHYLSKEFKTAAMRIESHRKFDAVEFTHYYLKTIPMIRYVYGKRLEWRRRVLDVAWVDRTPTKSKYGMPMWLEGMINERKRQVLRDAFSKINA